MLKLHLTCAETMQQATETELFTVVVDDVNYWQFFTHQIELVINNINLV
jgi:hypothetical protein